VEFVLIAKCGAVLIGKLEECINSKEIHLKIGLGFTL